MYTPLLPRSLPGFLMRLRFSFSLTTEDVLSCLKRPSDRKLSMSIPIQWNEHKMKPLFFVFFSYFFFCLRLYFFHLEVWLYSFSETKSLTQNDAFWRKITILYFFLHIRNTFFFVAFSFVALLSPRFCVPLMGDRKREFWFDDATRNHANALNVQMREREKNCVCVCVCVNVCVCVIERERSQTADLT